MDKEWKNPIPMTKGNAAGKSTSEPEELEPYEGPKCDVCGKLIYCGGTQTINREERTVIVKCNYCSENKIRIVKKDGQFIHLNRKDRRAKAKELRRR